MNPPNHHMNIQPSVIRTKLLAPILGHRSIQREKVIEDLNRTTEARLILFRAGAGFGKTVAMRQYSDQLQKKGMNTAWLTLDPLDDEFPRFLIHLITAFRIAMQGKRSVIDSLEFSSNIDELASDLIAEIDSHSEPFAVFIDQYELVLNSSCDDLLRLILSRMPVHGQLIIASRVTPNIQLGRLRALGQFIEIDQVKLCFSRKETTLFFLKDNSNSEISEANISKLYSDTEGWPAALWLASTALAGRKSSDLFIESFSGSNALVVEYLVEDILLQQSDERNDFLLKTSILKELNKPLCDILCDRDDSEIVLKELEFSSVCVNTIGEGLNLYRYNRLFAEFLRSQLKMQYSSQIPHLHLVAAKWYESEGRPVPAIEHALQSGDLNYAFSLLEKHVEDLLIWGRFRPLSRWLDAQSTATMKYRYRLRLAHIWSLTFTWRAIDALQLLETLEVDANQDDFTDKIKGEMEILRFFILATLDKNEELFNLVSVVPTISKSRSHFANNVYITTLATFKVASNQFSEAIELLEQSILKDSQERKTFSIAYSRCIEGTIDLVQARVREAISQYRVVLRESTSYYDRRSLTRSIAAIQLAEALHEVGLVEEPERLLALYMPVVREYGPPDCVIISHITEARIAYNRGDIDRAFLRLSELEHIGLQSHLPRFIASAQLERARIALLDDNTILAQKYYDRANNSEAWDSMNGMIMSANDIETVELCRFRLLIRGSIKDNVVNEIKAAIKTAQSSHRYRRSLKLKVILAKAQQVSGSKRQAMRTLQQALEIAFIDSQIRTFLDEGATIIELLREFRVAKKGTPEKESDSKFIEFIDKILQMGGCNVIDCIEDASIDIGVVLSARESQILDLLSLGLSNIRIAESIFVTETTVRAHLRKINVKLGTGNRTQAVSVARRLGLIK